MHGTHFFFVGELGAKATAFHIETLIDKVNHLKELLRRQGTASKELDKFETVELSTTPFG